MQAARQQSNDQLERERAALAALQESYAQELSAAGERYAALRLAREEKRRKRHEQYARRLVLRLVDLAFKAANYRELSDQSLIPGSLWRDWLRLFDRSLPLLPRHLSADPDWSDHEAEAEGEGEGHDEEAEAEAEGDAEQGEEEDAEEKDALSSSDSESDEDEAAKARRRRRRRRRQQQAGKPQLRVEAQIVDDGEQQIDPQDPLSWLAWSERPIRQLAASIKDPSAVASRALDDEALERYLAAHGEWAFVQHNDNKEADGEHKEKESEDGEQDMVGGWLDFVSRDPPADPSSSSSSSSSFSSSSSSDAMYSLPSSFAAIDSSARSWFVSSRLPAALLHASLHDQPLQAYSSSASIVEDGDPELSLALPSSSAASSSSSLSLRPSALLCAMIDRIEQVASGQEVQVEEADVPRFPLGVVLIGPPAAGKSTHASWLCRHYGLRELRPAAVVRDAIAKLEAGTPHDWLALAVIWIATSMHLGQC